MRYAWCSVQLGATLLDEHHELRGIVSLAMSASFLSGLILAECPRPTRRVGREPNSERAVRPERLTHSGMVTASRSGCIVFVGPPTRSRTVIHPVASGLADRRRDRTCSALAATGGFHPGRVSASGAVGRAPGTARLVGPQAWTRRSPLRGSISPAS